MLNIAKLFMEIKIKRIVRNTVTRKKATASTIRKEHIIL
jgi:hypothetical protein